MTKIASGVLSGVVRRLRASGLPSDVIEKAVLAAKGDRETSTNFQLTKSIRKQLFTLVQEHGPLVVTGRKALKIFRFDGYMRSRAASSANATKHQPWKLSKGPTKLHKSAVAQAALV